MARIFRITRRRVVINGKVVESTVEHSESTNAAESPVGQFAYAVASSCSSNKHHCSSASAVTVSVVEEIQEDPSL